MIVCICHRVSDRDIARTAQNGCASFDELQFELSVATSCGKCHDCARETFDRHAAQASGTEPHRTGKHPAFSITVHHPRDAATAAGA